MKFNGSSWVTLWGAGTSGIIGENTNSIWYINSNDIFKSGDFDNDGQIDLLCIAANGHSKIYNFNVNDWDYKWGNGYSGKLGEWNIRLGDQFYSFDMNNDGKSELFCISTDMKWEKIINFNLGTWITGWGNSGSYQIYNWDISPNDQFIFGKFLSGNNNQVLGIRNPNCICSNMRASFHDMPNQYHYKKININNTNSSKTS